MTAQLTLDGGAVYAKPERWCVLSDGCTTDTGDPFYRYELGCRWADGPIATWTLANPSTATAEVSDATTRKVTGFSKLWGCGAWAIVNVLPFRSRDPGVVKRILLDNPPEIGWEVVGGYEDENRAAITRALERAALEHGPVIFGWGSALPIEAAPLRLDAEIAWIADEVRRLGLAPQCLGLTRDGQPRHPLMLGYSTPLVPFEARP